MLGPFALRKALKGIVTSTFQVRKLSLKLPSTRGGQPLATGPDKDTVCLTLKPWFSPLSQGTKRSLKLQIQHQGRGSQKSHH